LPGGFHTAHQGHFEIQEHHVGPEALGSAHRLPAILSFPNHLNITGSFQQGAQPGANNGVVIGN